MNLGRGAGVGAAGGREEDEGRLGKAGRQRGQLAGWAVVAGTSWEELLESSRGGGVRWESTRRAQGAPRWPRACWTVGALCAPLETA